MSTHSPDEGFFFEEEDEELHGGTEQEKPKPRPRRRSGNRNRPKDNMSLLSKDKLEKLYNRVEPYLPLDYRKYIRGVVNGTQDVDPMREMELLVRQCSIIFSEASAYYWTEKKVTRDLAAFVDSLRGSIKDLHEMRRKEEELRASEGDMVDLRAEERRKMEAQINELLGIEE